MNSAGILLEFNRIDVESLICTRSLRRARQNCAERAPAEAGGALTAVLPRNGAPRTVRDVDPPDFYQTRSSVAPRPAERRLATPPIPRAFWQNAGRVPANALPNSVAIPFRFCNDALAPLPPRPPHSNKHVLRPLPVSVSRSFTRCLSFSLRVSRYLSRLRPPSRTHTRDPCIPPSVPPSLPLLRSLARSFARVLSLAGGMMRRWFVTINHVQHTCS